MIHKKDDNLRHGPLQIVHDFEFTALNVKDDYSALGRAGYGEKAEYIKSRIDRLCRLGYGGLVMNVNYKEYLRDPEAFKLFFESAKYAKSLGMRVWIYDEQYYPSGSAGGLTLIDHPELEAIGLACVTKDVTVNDRSEAIRVPSPRGYSELKFALAAPIVDGEVNHAERVVISDKKDLGGGLCFNAPVGKWRVFCFFIRPLYELTRFCVGTRASRRYISVFNKRAIEEFYRVTFEEGYKAHSKSPLSDIVDAIFTDEPHSPFYAKVGKLPQKTLMPSYSIYDEPDDNIEIYPYVPWEITVPQRFMERYGHSIENCLPDIFFDTPATKDSRIKFYTLISDMAKEAFPEVMSESLGKDGIALSGHYYGEEGFDFHPIFFGDIIQHLSLMQIPGCDSLWSEMDRLRYSISCKLASSAAHLAGRDEVMIEASNMVDKDQGITLQKAKAAISTMFVHGITLITSYYGENMLKEDEMYEFSRHISALGRLFSGGKYRINTLLYYPFENLCADRYPMGILEGNFNGEDHLGVSAAAELLMKQQICFDIINKNGLLSCELCNGYIKTPDGERVSHLVLPNIPWVDDEVAIFIDEAKKKGVKILINGENTNYEKLSSENCPQSELSLDAHDPYVIAMHRAFEGYDVFMLMNTDTVSHSINININANIGDRLSIIDILTEEERDLQYVLCEGKARISTVLPALEHLIIRKSSSLGE